MAEVEHGRDPCPYRIIDDMGGAFAMGAIGGSMWHAVRGAKNSPRNERFAGALTAIKSRAPVLGGNFAVWGGMFSVFDCSIAAMRRKEDPWNSIMSGALTGGCLAIRGGPRVAATSAVFGGVILAFIEGIGIVITRMTSDAYKPVRPMEPPSIPSSPPPPVSQSNSSNDGRHYGNDDSAANQDQWNGGQTSSSTAMPQY
jgi:import inner membrane translocase subunit TIM17